MGKAAKTMGFSKLLSSNGEETKSKLQGLLILTLTGDSRPLWVKILLDMSSRDLLGNCASSDY